MAAVRYTVALLTTPSLVDSLELFFGHTQAWKYYSYLYQLCYNRFYAILLRDGDALCAWRVERLLLTSSHLQVCLIQWLQATSKAESELGRA